MNELTRLIRTDLLKTGETYINGNILFMAGHAEAVCILDKPLAG